MSMPKTPGRPMVAISTPPSAGPPIRPIWKRSESSAPAAVSSSFSTRRGVSESSDGRRKPPNTAAKASTTNSTHTCGEGTSAFTSSAVEQSARPSSAMRTIRRLSTASANAPPTSAESSSGTSATSASRPTSAVEPVSW